MFKQMKWYLECWWTIMARPIYFYSVLKEESWKEKALSFLMITAWIAAFALTALIFIIQYIPIGGTLVEGITGYKFIIILPVLITLALVFSVITVLILGGVMVGLFGAASFAIAYSLHYIYRLLGGKGKAERMLQLVFYGSAVFLTIIFPVIFALLTKMGVLDFPLFRVGFNLFYGLTALFAYGLWAVAGRKNYGLSKTQAFVGALAPVILFLIFGFLFDKIVLPKLETWITPLK